MLRLLPLLFSVAAGDIEDRIRQRKRIVMLYGVLALVLLSAWFAALAGAVLVLAATYGTAEAAFLIAGALVVLALLVWIGLVLVRRRQRRNASPVLLNAAVAAAPLALRPASLAGLGLAGLAAYALGRLVTRPERR